jgi:hypothetical protein
MVTKNSSNNSAGRIGIGEGCLVGDFADTKVLELSLEECETAAKDLRQGVGTGAK